MLRELKRRLRTTLISTTGYKLVKARTSERFSGNAQDEREVEPFIREIMPAVEKNRRSQIYPDPRFIENYFTPKRLGMSRVLLDTCEELGMIIDQKEIIDIGCHAGYLLRLISQRYPAARLSGCDVYSDKVEMAKRACPKADVWQDQLNNLEAKSQYDIVFFIEVLEHVRDPEMVVKTLMKMKKPDGWLVMSVPDGREDTFPAFSFYQDFDAFGGHVNFWSPESWKEFLAKVGDGREILTTKLAYGCLLGAIR